MHPTDEALHLVAVVLLVVAAVLDLALIYMLKALSAGNGGRGEYVDEFRIILLLMGLGALYFAAQVWATDPARLHLLVDSATGPGSLVALVGAAVAMEVWLIVRLWRRRRRIFSRARARTNREEVRR